MDFADSARSVDLQLRTRSFLDEVVYPAEPVYEAQADANRAAGTPFTTPAIIAELAAEARRRGLWNLFLPDERFGAGLTTSEYAPIAELSGRAPQLAPEVMNCAAPDTGNMELLAMFGTDEQQDRWLRPLLDGRIRSCFSMTEPDVASSDATNIATRIERDGADYVVTGEKWWSTGALRPECRVAIVMGVSHPDAERHRRHSMVLVPLDAAGVTVRRSTTVFGYDDGPHGGHGGIDFNHVRVPAANLLGAEGAGFAMAQARLGPGRVHHCMRVLGTAERALAMMCQRAADRTAFGRPLAEQGVIRGWIAESRLALDQARLLVLKTAWLIDTVGVGDATTEIAAIKVAAPRAAGAVLERAIQVFGARGVSGDTPLAQWWAGVRALRLADGPDEVHLRSVARTELRRQEDS
ncbi:MAG TPA: acyl-CoA dehydrogenase family protein [Jatrophihabitantaceae bacterium]|jgi:acyl-CoA dehydrogenase|nr:acyl-CoA dehydrogenase family protein [Jatrophihabitantaceae bacterium]